MIETLKVNPHFTRLNLSNNGIRNSGLLAIGKCCRLSWILISAVSVLKKHPRLTHLDVSQNAISQQGGEALLELIRSNPNLKSLDFSGSKMDAALRLKLKSALEDNARAAGRA